MKINNPQQNIDNNKCTLFMKMKKCVFIFAVFKKAIDWVMIEMPENDSMPDANIMFCVVGERDNIFVPRVTSSSPNTSPSAVFFVIPNPWENLSNIFDAKSTMFSVLKISPTR